MQISKIPSLSATPVADATTPKPLLTAPPPTAPIRTESSDGRHISISEPTKSRKTSQSAESPQRDETALTMAMRQASAEAAKKADEKKSTQATPKTPLQEVREADTRLPYIDAAASSKLGKASEDPATQTETTAAKMPSQLAAEGAERTSIGKIEDVQSSGAEKLDEERPSLSAEQIKLDAQRSSSITKSKTPLSEGISADPMDDAPNYASRPTTHRGSSVSEASREEIKAAERRLSIQEEDEPEESKPITKTVAAKADLPVVSEAPAIED